MRFPSIDEILFYFLRVLSRDFPGGPGFKIFIFPYTYLNIYLLYHHFPETQLSIENFSFALTGVEYEVWKFTIFFRQIS